MLDNMDKNIRDIYQLLPAKDANMYATSPDQLLLHVQYTGNAVRCMPMQEQEDKWYLWV